jgi:hypothetical protein
MSLRPTKASTVRRTLYQKGPLLVLCVVVGLFVVMATVVALRTPAWEAADEPDHVQNVESFVGGHWYRMRPGSGNEAHQPPLYYLLLAGWQRVADQPRVVPTPGAGALFSGQPDRGAFARHRDADHEFLLWLRLPNVLLGALTVLLTAAAVQFVTEDRWTPVVAAAIVAMTPRFLFLSAFVTNDNLANLLGALLTFFALWFVKHPTAMRMGLVGGTVGLLVITKLSALPLAVVIVVTAAIVRRDWFGRARLALLEGAAAVVVSGWYLVQNSVRYGDPLARHASEDYLGPSGGLGTFQLPYRVTDPVAQIALHVPGKIARGFWYTSGWNQFRWSWPASIPFWFALAFALTGLIGARIPARTLLTLGSLTLAAFASVWIVSFQTASYEARLALTGLPALAALAALGVQRWRILARFSLPALGLIGVLAAVYDDVLAVNWR